MGRANPFRFSSKYQDDETDLVYYGYRYYNSGTGRWIARDPIAERSGHNIYAFLDNQTTARRDYLGLDFKWDTPNMHAEAQPKIVDEFEISGGVRWWYFRPHAPVFRHPDCSACRPYRLAVFGSATVWGWWVASIPDSLEQERRHILQDYYPAYLGFKAEAESYEHVCMSKAKAECFAHVIEHEMKLAYMFQAVLEGERSDWQEAGSPSTGPYYQDFSDAQYYYIDAASALQWALENCNEIQE
jgi:RHS repeat-associated protein